MTRELLDCLVSSQEEPGTTLLLHSKHVADCGASTAVVSSPDADVAVIGCCLAKSISSRLLFRTRTAHRVRFIDLTLVAHRLGSASDALIGLHALTGCDSISSFHGKGKKSGFNLA